MYLLANSDESRSSQEFNEFIYNYKYANIGMTQCLRQTPPSIPTVRASAHILSPATTTAATAATAVTTAAAIALIAVIAAGATIAAVVVCTKAICSATNVTRLHRKGILK